MHKKLLRSFLKQLLDGNLLSYWRGGNQNILLLRRVLLNFFFVFREQGCKLETCIIVIFYIFFIIYTLVYVWTLVHFILSSFLQTFIFKNAIYFKYLKIENIVNCINAPRINYEKLQKMTILSVSSLQHRFGFILLNQSKSGKINSLTITF